ncbi:MAG: glycosyltransferase, partial [Candidatus Omnitrophota bacterium]|nr:glycosyltransferase [Candidatus Omnitrophota bacterium]
MKKELPIVSVIVVNFNGKRFLADCFDSLFALDYPQDKLEIFMVDNGSSDGSIELVKEHYPKIKIMQNDTNNYCRANNLAIAKSRGVYIAMLNNDTKVDKNWLRELVAAIESDESIGAVGSKILLMDGSIESVGHQELHDFYWSDQSDLSTKETELKEAQSLCGCSILYRKKALEQAHNFDEDFNLYLEDVDMSIKLKKKGWKLAHAPNSLVFHVHHGTAQEELAEFYTERNRLLLVAKHYPEKLSSALLGRGYFTAQRDLNAQAGLYTILLDLVTTLLKYHKIETVKKVLGSLFAELKNISNYENNLLNQKIGELLKTVESQGELVKGKDQELLKREEYTRNLNSELGRKDQELLKREEYTRNLNSELGRREEAILQKDGDIQALRAEIDRRETAIKEKERYADSLSQEIVKRDKALQQKDAELNHLNAGLMSKEQALKAKGDYISNLNQNLVEEKQYSNSLKAEIEAFYNSTAFRFLVRPLWTVLGAIKKPFRKSLSRAARTEIRTARTRVAGGDVGICTIISKNYLAHARVLAESFKRYNRGEVFVLLTDRIDGYFDPRKENFTLIEIDQIKERILEFNHFCFQYNTTELNTAVKPFFLEFLFEKYNLEKLVFLDPDILITNNFEKIFSLLGSFSILLTPHITWPYSDTLKPYELDILRSGVYNLGFLGLANRTSAQTLLRWWKERLNRYCRVDLQAGLFVDQKWIDLIPGFFEDVFVIRDPSYNIAYWNFHYRKVNIKGSEIMVDDAPAHFLHFSGFNADDPRSVSRHQDRFKLKDLSHMKAVFNLYKEKLVLSGYDTIKNWPCAFEYFDNQAKIPDMARRIYWEISCDNSAKFKDPFRAAGKESYFNWLNENIDGKFPQVTRLMHEAYKQRLDLQRVFPDIFDVDRRAFAEWFLLSAKKEYGFDEAFFPQTAADKTKERKPPSVSIAAVAHYWLRNLLRICFKVIFRNNLRMTNNLKNLDRNLQRNINRLFNPSPNQGRHKNLTDKKKGVNVFGYITSEMGVGEAVRADIKCLKSAGIDFSLVNITSHSPSRKKDLTFSEFSSLAPYDINLLHVNADMLPKLYLEKNRNNFRHKYNIGSWTWELADFPQEDIKSFNYCDEIWVPSNFVLDAVSKKSPVPAVKIPYAVVIDQFKKLKRADFGLSEEDFMFLFSFDFFSYFERKNPLALIRAFNKAFANNEKARLVIKCSNSSFDPAALANLQKEAAGKRVNIIDKCLYKEEVNSLMSLCDCYVSLHRSE